MIIRQILEPVIDFVSRHYVACTLATITLCILSCGMRNRYFLPLRHFEEPFWGSITDFYHLRLFASKKVHVMLLGLHEKHGPFVRVAPNLLSVSDPWILPQIYTRHAEKTPFYSAGMAGEDAPLLQVKSDREHATKLKALGPTYSLRNMRQLEHVVDDQILRTMAVFDRRFAAIERPMDVAEYTRWHVYDTMTQLIYGKPVGMVEQGSDIDGLIRQWHKIFTLGGLLATLPWLIHPIISAPLLRNMLMPHKRIGYGSGHIMSVHEKLFASRLKSPELGCSGTLMDSLLRSRNMHGELMTKGEAEHECFILTVGSQDTSASFISAFINFIVQHPDVHRRLLEEIKEYEERQLLSSPVATYDQTCELKYFMTCVWETLRLSPSVSMILPRYSPEEGILINDNLVPPGVELAANPYVIHRNTEIFGDDAQEFRPKRWTDSPPAQLSLMRKYFLAFGYGSRRCLGRNIALFESQKFLIQLFREFEVRSSNPTQPFRTQNWGINMYWKQFLDLSPRWKGEIS